MRQPIASGVNAGEQPGTVVDVVVVGGPDVDVVVVGVSDVDVVVVVPRDVLVGRGGR